MFKQKYKKYWQICQIYKQLDEDFVKQFLGIKVIRELVTETQIFPTRGNHIEGIDNYKNSVFTRFF